MARFEKVQGVARMCGDYCAWHEASVYVEWVFGKYWHFDDGIGETLCEQLDIDWEDIEKQDKAEMDKMVKKIVEESDSDYCDMETMSVIIELNDNDKVITTAIVA